MSYVKDTEAFTRITKGENFKKVKKFIMMKNIWFIYSNVRFVKNNILGKYLRNLKMCRIKTRIYRLFIARIL